MPLTVFFTGWVRFAIPDIPGIISVVTAGIISVVGIILVVIGGHFGGGDHFDGGDHFGGGTASD